jgi:hypothetical protein
MTKKKQPTLADALKSVSTAIANLHIKLAAATDEAEREELRKEIASISQSMGLHYAGPADQFTAEQAAEAATIELQNSENTDKYDTASDVIFKFVPGLAENMLAEAETMREAAAAQGAAEALAKAAETTATPAAADDQETVTLTIEHKPSLWFRIANFFGRNKKTFYWVIGTVVAGAVGYTSVNYVMSSNAAAAAQTTGWVHGSTEVASDASVGFFAKALEAVVGAWHYVGEKASGLFAWVGSWFSKSADAVTEVAANGTEAPAAV